MAKYWCGLPEPSNLTQLYVDNVYYGQFDEPDSAITYLNENVPAWGDRDIHIDSERGEHP